MASKLCRCRGSSRSSSSTSVRVMLLWLVAMASAARQAAAAGDGTGGRWWPLPAPAFGLHANPVPAGVYKWQPRPLEGPLAVNTRLRAAVRLFNGQVHGAESVVVGPNGQLVMLDRYNHLLEATQDSSGSGEWKLAAAPRARLGPGRPLGYHFDAAGNLIVCDSLKGLVQYDYSTRQVAILASHVSDASRLDPGTPITYANDLAIAPDGTIYFTSCTDIVPPLNALGFWDTFRAWFLSLMQGAPRGRLLRYDPATRQAHVIAKGFYYANGVALSAAGDYLVLAETDRIRAHRVWLQGPKAGHTEVLIDSLPGMPDGVDEALDGGFWISLVAPAPPFTSPLLTAALSSPAVRALHAWLPPRLRPGLRSWGAVVKVDGETGRITDFLMDPEGKQVATVSAVVEQRLPGQQGSRLWLGNLVGAYVSYLDLPPPSSAASSAAAAGSAAAAAAGQPGGGGGTTHPEL